MSGGGNNSSYGGPAGPGQGGPNRPGTGGPAPSGPGTGPFTWNGRNPASTFDPKNFGTQLFGDLSTAYGQGPKINPIANYTPFSAQTSGLINRGLSDIEAFRSGPMAGVAAGDWLGGNQNPYREAGYQTTRDNIMKDVGDVFNSSGRFGGGSYVDRAVDQIATSENPQRAQDFENEWSRYLGANSALQGANATGLGYSGLLDSKAAEKTASDQDMWNRTNNAPFNHIAQYLGALRGGDSANETNKPLSLWDILGGIGGVVGSIL